MLGGGRKTIKTFTGFHLDKSLGESILKNKKFGGVAFCTILVSELSHHVRATFCATFGILFPYVLSLENYICSNDVVYLFGGEASPPCR